jgi:hypothetical protein
MVSPRHQRHPHFPLLHSLNRQHMGGHPQPRSRHGRLATTPAENIFCNFRGSRGRPLSTTLRLCSTHNYHVSLRNGKTPNARTSTASTSRTKYGYAITTNATSHGQHYPRWQLSSTKPAQQLPLSPLLAEQTVAPAHGQPRQRDGSLPPSRDLFSSGMLGTRVGDGQPRWGIAVFD